VITTYTYSIPAISGKGVNSCIPDTVDLINILTTDPDLIAWDEQWSSLNTLECMGEPIT